MFGLVAGLIVHIAGVPRFDRWMLLLTIGTFAGAYPLMCFAQEYLPLGSAVAGSAAVALAVIGVRSVSLLGWRLGVGGVVLPAAVILAVALVAALYPRLQGIVLTAGALGFFVTLMQLLPRLRLTDAFLGTGGPPAAGTTPPDTAPAPGG